MTHLGSFEKKVTLYQVGGGCKEGFKGTGTSSENLKEEALNNSDGLLDFLRILNSLNLLKFQMIKFSTIIRILV